MDTKEDYRLNVWSEGLKVLIGIVYLMLSLAFIRYMGFTFWYLYVYFLCTGLLFSAVHWFKGFTIKGFVKSALGLLVFMFLMRGLGRIGGVWGYVVGVGVLCAFLLYSRRKQYLRVKYHIESMLFGKPLKEYIKNKEELPRLRIKF